MAIPLSELIVPVCLGGLGSLKTILEKSAAHCEEHKIDPRALLDARLFPNMFTFTRQVQAATDLGRRGLERLMERELSSVEDNEQSFEELSARVESTLAQVRDCDRGKIDASATREFTAKVGVELKFTGLSYAQRFVIPNLLFHATTAYDIMRHNGVVLSKRDYIAPFMNA